MFWKAKRKNLIIVKQGFGVNLLNFIVKNPSNKSLEIVKLISEAKINLRRIGQNILNKIK